VGIRRATALIGALGVVAAASAAVASPFGYLGGVTGPGPVFSAAKVMSVVDFATGTVAARVPLPVGVASVAVDPSGSRVYLSADYPGGIYAIDTKLNVVVGRFVPGLLQTIAPQLIALNPAGTRLYGAELFSTQVLVLDPATLSIVDTIDLGRVLASPHSYGLAVSPDGTKLYVGTCNQDGSCLAGGPCDGAVSVVDTATDSPLATIPVDGCPKGIAVSPSGTTVYAAGFLGYDAMSIPSSTLSVIDTATDTVTASVPFPSERFEAGILVDPTGGKLYVASVCSGDCSAGAAAVYVLDTATNTVVTSIPVPGAPLGVDVNPAGTRLYVATATAGVVVVDTATNTAIDTLTVPDGALVFGRFLGPLCPNACDDGNPCTSDTCDPANGCMHTSTASALGGQASGCVPPDSNTAKCETNFVKAVSKALVCIMRCHQRSVVKHVDDEDCESGPGRSSCRSSYARATDAASTLEAICPACLDAPTRAQLFDTLEAILDKETGVLHCKNPFVLGGIPIGDDDFGFVSSDTYSGRCQNAVAQNLSTATACILGCHVKRVTGRQQDAAAEAACITGGCLPAYQARYTRAAVGVACVKAPDALCTPGPLLFDARKTLLDTANGLFFCAQ
jgi:YVTN family beta-propeller protein